MSLGRGGRGGRAVSSVKRSVGVTRTWWYRGVRVRSSVEKSVCHLDVVVGE